VEIAPNPNTGDFLLHIEQDVAGPMDLALYRVNRQLIYEAYLDQEFTVVNTQLFLEERVKGIYFLRITTNSGIVTKKVIVH